MKTAISVPDATFERVEQYTAEHGLNRSEFYARAAETYLEQLEAASATEEINAALDLLDTDGSAEAAVSAGRRVLAAGEDDW